ncbi:MAG: ELM1/GtrOC1 family putative glycosyltransferase [Candidatus Omnitrophota bacterium]
MKNNSIVDYLACILLRTIGPAIRSLHPLAAFWIGARLGELVFAVDVKHRSIAYSNLKTAFGDRLPPGQIRRLTLEFYRSFGQNIIEIFLIPVIDGKYAQKYVTIEGLENVKAAFQKGKGVFFVSIHEGSWELSNILATHLNIPFSMFVREQKMPRLNELLNSYRKAKGCKIIRKEDQTRELIRLIRANESCGMSVDQGGRDGVRVRFFNKDASMAAGAVRLALKYDAALVPVFSTRLRGPYIKLIIEPPVQLARTGNIDDDIKTNLQDLILRYQKYLGIYPKEYLWHYRVWKYSLRRDVLILSDEKTGHVRQSQALARIVSGYLREKGIETVVHEVPVHFKNALCRSVLAAAVMVTCRSVCQGCLICLRRSLNRDSYRAVTSIKCDIVISCGSSLAAVNRMAAIENQAKSIIIMKPAGTPLRKFDLAVIASHDKPVAAPNVVITRGALNLIDEPYLRASGGALQEHIGVLDKKKPVIGALFGGDAKSFRLDKALVEEVSAQLNSSAQALDAALLVTTSRRTPAGAQAAIKAAFEHDRRCRFLVIANERNFDFAVGGILDKADIVVISPESISMVSEAASGRAHVVVFDSCGLSRKHRALLDDFQSDGLIRLVKAGELSGAIMGLCRNKPGRRRLDDTAPVIEGLRKIL